ncbi:MAG: c-type cytochrome [Desulfuromonas sp.]|nr:c-type cytochrome [Desulfuromonas sp.]
MTNSDHHDFDGITENREQRPPAYFTVLFYGLIVWGVAFCAFYLLSGWSSDAEFQVKMKAHETGGQSAAAPPAGKMEAAVKPTEPAPPQPQQPAAAPAAAAVAATAAKPDAKALFAGKCAMCHGSDAKGGFGPDLTKATYEYGKNREAIAMSIGQGRGNGKMPAFEGQLKREEIHALADYLLTLK